MALRCCRRFLLCLGLMLCFLGCGLRVSRILAATIGLLLFFTPFSYRIFRLLCVSWDDWGDQRLCYQEVLLLHNLLLALILLPTRVRWQIRTKGSAGVTVRAHEPVEVEWVIIRLQYLSLSSREEHHYSVFAMCEWICSWHQTLLEKSVANALATETNSPMRTLTRRRTIILGILLFSILRVLTKPSRWRMSSPLVSTKAFGYHLSSSHDDVHFFIKNEIHTLYY